jgi:hypothetical protein
VFTTGVTRPGERDPVACFAGHKMPDRKCRSLTNPTCGDIAIPQARTFIKRHNIDSSIVFGHIIHICNAFAPNDQINIAE